MRCWDRHRTVVIAAITAGIGGKIGKEFAKVMFPSTFITSFERRWYTLWLYDHRVVRETYDKVGRESAAEVFGGGIGGGLSAVPSEVSDGNSDCGCS